MNISLLKFINKIKFPLKLFFLNKIAHYSTKSVVLDIQNSCSETKLLTKFLRMFLYLWMLDTVPMNVKVILNSKRKLIIMAIIVVVTANT